MVTFYWSPVSICRSSTLKMQTFIRVHYISTIFGNGNQHSSQLKQWVFVVVARFNKNTVVHKLIKLITKIYLSTYLPNYNIFTQQNTFNILGLVVIIGRFIKRNGPLCAFHLFDNTYPHVSKLSKLHCPVWLPSTTAVEKKLRPIRFCWNI